MLESIFYIFIVTPLGLGVGATALIATFSIPFWLYYIHKTHITPGFNVIFSMITYPFSIMVFIRTLLFEEQINYLAEPIWIIVLTIATIASIHFILGCLLDHSLSWIYDFDEK